MSTLDFIARFPPDPGEACGLYAEHASDAHAVARGLGEFLGGEARLFEVTGKYLLPPDGPALLQPLLGGETVVLLTLRSNRIAERFAEVWHRARDSQHYFAGIDPLLDLRLDGVPTEGRGRLFGIQIGGEPARFGAVLHRLDAAEVARLEQLGAGSSRPVARVGRDSRASASTITHKDLCLLHTRDGDTAIRADTELVDRRAPVTWTDLQALLRLPSREAELEALHVAGLVERERLDWYLEAGDCLQEWPAEHVRSDVWEAVWRYSFMEEQGYVFRGQFDERWRLDSTLFRASSGAGVLDVGTLSERVELTRDFLEHLASDEPAIERSLTDAEALAVAQHHGFATPLLDFSRSLRVGAFFATLDARRRSDLDGMVGVIYAARPEHDPGRALQLSGERLDGIRLGDLHPFREAQVKVGSWQLIEPHLHGTDDRIGRQRGVFLADYHLRDLREAHIDRILFRQHAGDVFEDPVAGVTEGTLLPADAPLAALAGRVKAARAARRRKPVPDAMLAATALPQPSIIGSLGSHLAAQADETEHFFEDLQHFAKDWGLEDRLGDIERAVTTFFHDAASVADRGTIAGERESVAPIDRALAELDRLAGLDSQLQPLLRGLVPEVAHLEPERGPDLTGMTADTALEVLAIACALFLAGWENLIRVRGWRARALMYTAREILLEARPEA